MSWSLHCKTIYRGQEWQFCTIPTGTAFFFIVPIDRSVHNTNVSYRFIHQLYQIHFGCTEKYIKFRPINAYRPKLDKHFPLYFSYLDIKFVPHYQDLIPFSPFLFLCLFSTFSNFQLCMFLPRALHYCMFSISPSLSLTISLMFSFPFFYYFFKYSRQRC